MIDINSGFKLGTDDPIDERIVFNTLSEMRYYDENVLPPIYFCLCKEDNEFYIYNVDNEYDDTYGRWRKLREDFIDDTHIKNDSAYSSHKVEERLETKQDKFSVSTALSFSNNNLRVNVGNEGLVVTGNNEINLDFNTVQKVISGSEHIRVSATNEISVVDVATLDNGKVPLEQLPIDTYLNPNSNNLIKNSTVYQSISAVNTNIANEITRATQKEQDIINSISATTVNVMNTINNVKSNLEGQIQDEVQARITEDGQLTIQLNNLSNRVTSINDTLTQEIVTVTENLEKRINDTVLEFEEDIGNLSNSTNSKVEHLQTTISNLSNTVNSKEQALNTKIDTNVENLQSSIDNLSKDTSDKINTINSNISTINTNLVSTNNRVNSINQTLSQSILTTKNDLSNSINNVNQTLSNRITEVDNTLSNNINTVNTTLNQTISAVNSTLTESISSINSELSNKIDTVNSTLNNTIEENIENLTNRINTLDTTIEQEISDITKLVPAQASEENKLADKDFVNNAINSNSAYYITKDVEGNPFPTKASLTSASVFYYAGQERTPTKNDYCLVQSDESQSTSLGNPSCRYVFSGVWGEGGTWDFQYKVNDTAFTSEQLQALNSHITQEKVEKLDGIENGAEVNVQSDWTENDTTKDTYIKNKPTIDSTLNANSTNAIQNGVVTNAISLVNTTLTSSISAVSNNVNSINATLTNNISTLSNNINTVNGTLSNSITEVSNSVSTLENNTNAKFDTINSSLENLNTSKQDVLSGEKGISIEENKVGHSNTPISSGTVGGETEIPVLTYDTLGHLTSVSSVSVSIPSGVEVTLNGEKNDNPDFYAPTSVGTSKDYLRSSGAGSPSWVTPSTILNDLTTGASSPQDNDYYISQYAGGGTTTTTYHRRPHSALWNYIKSKLSTVAETGDYNDLINKPSLSTVATSGSYTDLTNTPSLSNVATSGSYNDLTNKPTIPTVPSTYDWSSITNKPSFKTVATNGSYNDLTNRPSLKTVATNGSYNDLLNKPTIPTVNNGTLTIQKNGTTVNTFTANSSSNVTCNLSIPTMTLSGTTLTISNI